MVAAEEPSLSPKRPLSEVLHREKLWDADTVEGIPIVKVRRTLEGLGMK